MNIIINDKPCSASLGEKLSRIAQENQCHVGYVCGGHGICQTCYVTVFEGRDCLSPLSEIERAFLSERQISSGGRLACQTTIEKEGTIRVISRPEEVRRMLLQNPLSLFSYGAEMGKAAAERFIPGVSNVIDRIRKGEMNSRENLGDVLEGMGFAIRFGASTAADNIPFKDQFNALLDLIQRFAPFSLPGTSPKFPSVERVSLTVSGAVSQTSQAPSSELEVLGITKADGMKRKGITTVASLLERGCDPHGRKALAAELHIDEKELLSIVNCADLCRIKGIDMKIAGLLEASGVDTIPELSHRNPGHLHSKIKEVNRKEKILASVPSLSDLETWIAEAKKLPRVMTY